MWGKRRSSSSYTTGAAGIVAVVAVPHLDDEIVAVRAVDEPFPGEPLRLVVRLPSLGQPDLYGNEMKRHRLRWSPAATIVHATSSPNIRLLRG